MCHNYMYLRKNSNKTIEILFKISGQIRPLQIGSLIQFQKVQKVNLDHTMSA